MTWYRRIGDGYETTVDMEWPELSLVIPAGYRFNVSVPKRWQWFVDPHDPRYFEAALMHDYAIHELGFSRPLAAGYFNEGLRNADVALFKRKLLWVVLGLRKFR